MASILALVLLGLVGCETAGVRGWAIGPGEDRAERLAAAGNHEEAAGIYIGLAADASGGERDRLTLLAVEQWLDAGDVARARNALGGVARPAGDELRWLWNTNSAALSLYDGEPDAALDLLDPMSNEAVTRRHRLRMDALRADAWIQKRDPLRAIELRTRREAWIEDAEGIRQNRRRLWESLLVLDTPTLREAADLALYPQARGWLELGALARVTGQQGIGWAGGMSRWRERYVDHPAIVIIDEIEIIDGVLAEYPRRIGVLLPLSGRAAPAGRAIQNGLLAAFLAARAGLDGDHVLRFYDVDAEGGASAAYSTAVTEGAEFVIGPLLKDQVVELANDTLVPVPVLTLNYLPEDSLAPPNLFQFALSPEDEARSAAQRAVADGYERAVALVPMNDWGRRLLTSFSAEFAALGGTLLDYRSYLPSEQDFSRTIEDLMALTGSVRRYQRLRANIGGPLQFDPRRRQDVELVFLAADADAGRLLKAQLRFHYSGDLPVYSTSAIYALDGRPDTDLNGTKFADTPWILSPPDWLEGLPAAFAQYWPEERRLTRLHAMGYDAFQLIAALHGSRTGPMQEIGGATGTLYLDAEGRVHRRLSWAQFVGGEPVALPDAFPDEELPEFGDPGETPPALPIDDR